MSTPNDLESNHGLVDEKSKRPFDWSSLFDETLVSACLREDGRCTDPDQGSFHLKWEAAKKQGFTYLRRASDATDDLSLSKLSGSIERPHLTDVADWIANYNRQKYFYVWPVSEKQPLRNLRNQYFHGLLPPQSLVAAIRNSLRSDNRITIIKGAQDCGKTPLAKRWILDSIGAQPSTLGLPKLAAWAIIQNSYFLRGRDAVDSTMAQALRQSICINSGIRQAYEYNAVKGDNGVPVVFTREEEECLSQCIHALKNRSDGKVFILIDMPRGCGQHADSIDLLIKNFSDQTEDYSEVCFIIFARDDSALRFPDVSEINFKDYNYVEKDFDQFLKDGLSGELKDKKEQLLSVLNFGDYNANIELIERLAKGVEDKNSILTRFESKESLSKYTYRQFSSQFLKDLSKIEARRITYAMAWCYLIQARFCADNRPQAEFICGRLMRFLQKNGFPKDLDLGGEDQQRASETEYKLVLDHFSSHRWGKLCLQRAAFFRFHCYLDSDYDQLANWCEGNLEILSEFEEEECFRLANLEGLPSDLLEIYDKPGVLGSPSHQLEIVRLDQEIDRLKAEVKRSRSGVDVYEQIDTAARLKRELQIKIAVERGMFQGSFEGSFDSIRENASYISHLRSNPDSTSSSETEWVYFAGPPLSGKSTAIILFAAWIRQHERVLLDLKHMQRYSSQSLYQDLSDASFVKGNGQALPPSRRTASFCALVIKEGTFPDSDHQVILADSPGEQWVPQGDGLGAFEELEADQFDPLNYFNKATLVLCLDCHDLDEATINIDRLEQIINDVRAKRDRGIGRRLPLKEVWLLTQVDRIASDFRDEVVRGLIKNIETRRRMFDPKVISMDVGPFIEQTLPGGIKYYLPPARRRSAPFEQLANAIAQPRRGVPARDAA